MGTVGWRDKWLKGDLPEFKRRETYKKKDKTLDEFEKEAEKRFLTDKNEYKKDS